MLIVLSVSRVSVTSSSGLSAVQKVKVEAGVDMGSSDYPPLVLVESGLGAV